MLVEAPPVVGYDHLDVAFQADPYETWAAMRTTAPLHRWADADAWVVVGHDLVREVLRDGATYSPSNRYWKHFQPHADAAGNRRMIRKVEANGLFTVAEDRHTRQRRVVSRAFTPASIALLEPRIVERVTDHLDRIEGAGHADLVTDLARHVPVEVIADLLGLDEDDAAWFRQRVDPILHVANPFATPEDLDETEEALVEVDDFLEARFAERRRRPGADLLSRLLEVEAEGDRLSHDELLSLVVGLLLAGAETTQHLIGMGTLALLEHPGELARLRVQPALWPNAIDELLRWSYINKGLPRFTRTTAVLRLGPGTEVEIAPGELLFVAIGSALRDLAPGAGPDRLDVARPAGDTLAFGIGSHYCVGAALARLEGRVALSTIFDRLPGLQLDGEPRYLDQYILRGLASLPVRW